MNKNLSLKEMLGAQVASMVSDGDVLAIGTGTTVDAAIVAIGKRVKEESLKVSGVTSSVSSARLCFEYGISILDSSYAGQLVFGFDGADAINDKKQAIKGKGGAMLKEKILASKVSKFIVVADESKLCKDLAKSCPVPVEVIPEALSRVEKELVKLGASDMNVRLGKSGESLHGPIFTEFGGNIIDVTFKVIEDGLEDEIKKITGVIESGLFLSQIDEVIIGSNSGITRI